MNDKYIDNIQQCDLQTVWCEGIEPNVELKFCCYIKKQQKVIAQWIAKDIYNLFINGKFIAYGPARAAKGYARVETMELDKYLTEENNKIEIYVQSNYTNLLCHTKEEPYLGICIKADDKVIKNTKDFKCYSINNKLQRVERMSSQRGFLEVYREGIEETNCEELKIIPVKCPKILKRNVPYSDNIEEQATLYKKGYVEADKNRVWENDLTKLLDDGLKMGGYPRKDCECVLSKELLQFVPIKRAQDTNLTDDIEKKQLSDINAIDELSVSDAKKMDNLCYYIYKIPKVYCGKFRFTIQTDKSTDLWITYDDLLVDDFVMFNREQIVHGLKWTLKPGEYILYSQEVYSAKYIQIICGSFVNVKDVSLIRIENPLNNLDKRVVEVSKKQNSQFINNGIKTIVEAAKNTFAQNAYDLYTDCPSRERAGWLCDSYFMGKAEHFFTGNNVVEKNFLENYLLYENEVFEHKGIMPMCYPAQLGEHDYIPNWILWYVLELEDYLKRTNDLHFIELHYERIREILNFFEKYENEQGLLEGLEGWVFIEWSEASDYVEGVNFPTNMLYAAALDAASNILSDNSLKEKALNLKKLIREIAYDGEFYVDNAIRVNGELELTNNRSELCQIFAAYFDIEPNDKNFYERFVVGYEKYGVKKVINKKSKSDKEKIFGEQNNFEKNELSEESNKYIAPAALFIGGILRLMVLFNLEKYEKVIEECQNRFLEMTEKTGTIWEFFDEKASCNHGFGSIIGWLICESLEKLNKNVKQFRKENC